MGVEIPDSGFYQEIIFSQPSSAPFSKMIGMVLQRMDTFVDLYFCLPGLPTETDC